MKYLLKITFHVIAAMVALAMLLVVGLIWRLSSEPIRTDRLTPYLQDELAKLLPGAKATVGSSLLVWDNEALSLSLEAEGVELHDAEQQLLLTAPAVKFGFSSRYLLIGRFLPQHIEMTKPQLNLTRLANGKIVLGAGSPADTDSPEATPQDLRQTLVTALHELTRNAALSHLDVRQTIILIRDAVSGKEYTYSIPEISLMETSDGLEGNLQFEIIHRTNTTTAHMHYRFDSGKDTHQIITRLADFNPSGIAEQFGELNHLRNLDIPFTGEVSAVFDDNLHIISLLAAIEAGSGTITAPDFWDAPRAIKNATLELQILPEVAGKLIGKIDVDLGGTNLTLDLSAVPVDRNTPSLYDYQLALRLLNLPMDKFTSVWPKSVVNGARSWIAANMRDGVFKSGNVTMRGRTDLADLNATTLTSYEGSIDASNATVRYIEGMPAVQNVSAAGTFNQEKMDIKILGGGLNGIKMLPFTVSLTDFQTHPQNAYIPLKISGSVPDILKLLNAPRLKYADKIGINPANTVGTAEGVVEFRFPMLKDINLDTMGIKATAVLKNFGATDIAASLDLSDSTLNLNLDNAGIKLDGPVRLNRIPMRLVWDYRFAPVGSELAFKADLSGQVQGDQWRQLGIDLPLTITGPTDVKAAITQQSGKPVKISGEANFRLAGIDVPKLNWIKEASKSAVLSIVAEIPSKGPINISKIDLRGEDFRALGNLKISASGEDIIQADFKPFQLGRSNVTISYNQSNASASVHSLTIDGSVLDISGFLTKSTTESSTVAKDTQTTSSASSAANYKINVARVYTGLDTYLSEVRVSGARAAEGWREFDIQGIAMGEVGVVAKLATTPQGRNLTMSSDNFGVMLRGLGLTSSVTGGKLSISGTGAAAISEPINGKIAITSFSAGDLPVLVRLLNAISPLGFADLIHGRSSFDRLWGKFVWSDHSLDLVNIRMSGSTYGMNLGGKLNFDSNQANLTGTLVPLSFVNNLLGQIPLVGDLITGGEGQGVFAVAYSIKGPLDNTDITVNPVSVLMPGFVRNLFFGAESD